MLNIYVTSADCECIAVGENSGGCDLGTDFRQKDAILNRDSR